MPREERRVDVERSDVGDRENLFIEDLSIARDDEDIGLLLTERGGEAATSGRLRLEDGHSALISERGDSAALQRATTATRAIRAGYDE